MFPPRDNVIPRVVSLDSKFFIDSLVWNEHQPEKFMGQQWKLITETYLSSVQPSSNLVIR